jgi:hypothetical protein
MRGILLAALALFVAPVPASATVWIRADPGGIISEYQAAFSKLRFSGEQVVIDGPCLSACTLVLSTIPRNRICVTSKAVFGFHAAYSMDEMGHKFRAQDQTRAMAASYPTKVRTWINRNGGLNGRMIFLRGRELADLYHLCKER